MPTLNARQADQRDAENAVLKKLLNAAGTQRELGCTRHRLLKLLDAKLIKRAGEAKNQPGVGRKAVSYELTGRGRKRAEKL